MSRFPKMTGLVSGLVLSGLVAACDENPTRMVIGNDPNTAALDQLVVGVSSRAEIARLVGPPRGRGKALIPGTIGKRDLMFYELVVAEAGLVDLKMLVVMMKDDLYDGHFWFSSVEPYNRGSL